MTNVNCRLFDRGLCNHTSAQRLFFPNKACIESYQADPRVGYCRVKVEYPEPQWKPPVKP